MNDPHPGDDWMCHGWDDHVRGQLEHGRSLTFRQRLERREEMSEIVARLRRNPEWLRRNALVEGRDLAVREDPPPRPSA